MSDCRFGVSPVNYPDPDIRDLFIDQAVNPEKSCFFIVTFFLHL